jgi:hypothetical protein
MDKEKLVEKKIEPTTEEILEAVKILNNCFNLIKYSHNTRCNTSLLPTKLEEIKLLKKVFPDFNISFLEIIYYNSK